MDYDNDDLLALWMLTGGVARYVELLMEDGALTRESMFRAVFGGISSFVEIKRDASRISLADLRKKSEAFYAKNPSFRSRRASFAGLSIKDR